VLDTFLSFGFASGLGSRYLRIAVVRRSGSLGCSVGIDGWHQMPRPHTGPVPDESSGCYGNDSFKRVGWSRAMRNAAFIGGRGGHWGERWGEALGGWRLSNVQAEHANAEM